jgi:hypothetical protein
MRSGFLPGCPTEDDLCGFADGTLQEGRERIEAHVADCDRCLALLAELGVAGRFVGDARLESPPPELEWRVTGRPLAVGEPRDWRARWRRLGDSLFSFRGATALAAASAVAVVFLWLGSGPSPQPDAPSAPREGEAFAAAPVPLEPHGEIAGGGDVHFRWEPCPQSAHSVITILDADGGHVLVREAVTAPEYVLPAERLAGAAGHRFEWVVECVLEDGRHVTSAVVPFTLPGGE